MVKLHNPGYDGKSSTSRARQVPSISRQAAGSESVFLENARLHYQSIKVLSWRMISTYLSIKPNQVHDVNIPVSTMLGAKYMH